MPGGVENIIKYCTESGISSIELMSNDLEDYLGAPKNPIMAFFEAARAAAQAAGAPPSGASSAGQPQGAATAGQGRQAGPPPGGFQRPEFTAEQKAAIEKYNQDIKAWRLALPMSKVEEAR